MEDTEIVAVREMTDEEYDQMYWSPNNMGRAQVIELIDGTKLFASRDMEGNDAGFLSGLPRKTSDAVGETIESIAPMAEPVMKQRGWKVTPHNPAPPVLSLSNGYEVYPAVDGEENAPGALFGFDPTEDDTFVIMFEEEN